MSFDKQPSHIKIGVYKKLARDNYNASLYSTAKNLLGYKDMTPHTHGKMCEALEDDTVTRKLIVMPRGTFKSSIASVAYPIWRLNKDPNLRIMIDSEVYTNSKNFLREIKAHMETNEAMKQLYGEYKTKNWNEAEFTINQRTVIKKESSCVASGISAVKVGLHFDLIICDDLNSQNNSETVEGRAKVIRHYQRYTGLLDPGGEIVVIGTRYATDDVIGHILDNEVDK